MCLSVCRSVSVMLVCTFLLFKSNQTTSKQIHNKYSSRRIKEPYLLWGLPSSSRWFGADNFHVNPRFYPTDTGRNQGLTQKIPTPWYTRISSDRLWKWRDGWRWRRYRWDGEGGWGGEGVGDTRHHLDSSFYLLIISWRQKVKDTQTPCVYTIFSLGNSHGHLLSAVASR